MAIDLWGFKDVKDLEKNTSDFPETILKEQISALGDKTGFVLYGKPLYSIMEGAGGLYSLNMLFWLYLRDIA